MKIVAKIFWTFLLIGGSIVIFWLIAFLIVFPLIFPDIEDLGRTSNLFVEVSGRTGYHPEPSTFFIWSFPVLGFIIGLFITYRLIGKKKLTRNEAKISN